MGWMEYLLKMEVNGVQGKSGGHRRREAVGCGERVEGTMMIW